MTNLLSLITPTNLESERERFFESTHYNPLFHYNWQDQLINPTFSIKLKYPIWYAIQNQDHDEIVSAAKELFEVDITTTMLSSAKDFAQVKGYISGGNADQYATLMQEALLEFDIQDISIIISDEAGFNARPSHAKKCITISKHIHFEYFSMEGGVRHELVHVLRYRNGKHNSVKRSQNFLPTEEGLASWCQDNTNDDNGLAQHAIEYVASDIGLRGSLRDVYDTMRELGMSKDLAWKRACRHKFGFVDTSQPGDILKPAMYFANEEKVNVLSTEEKLRLFIGKISIGEISEYPNYAGLWEAAKLINYFRL